MTEITTIQDIAQLSVHDYYIVVEREPTPTIHVIALPDDIKGGQYWQLDSINWCLRIIAINEPLIGLVCQIRNHA